MVWSNLLAEERRFLKCDRGDGRIVGQVVLLSHCLVLDERSIRLEEARVVALIYVSMSSFDRACWTDQVVWKHFVVTSNKW